MSEIFVDAKNLPGYQVSNMGKVIGVKGKILKLAKNPAGDMLFNSAGGKTIYVKKLVAENFIPNPKQLDFVLFKDKDKSNCCVYNLYWSDISYYHDKHISSSTSNGTNTHKIGSTKAKTLLEDILVPARLNDWAMCKRKIIKALKICDSLGVNL